MFVVIQFEENIDCERAIDVLGNARETYHSIPKNCFLISTEAAQLLVKKGVYFKVVKGELKEKKDVSPS